MFVALLYYFGAMTKVTALYLFLATLLPLGMLAQDAMNVTTIDKSKVPAGVKYTGRLKHALRFTDKQGTHVVLTAETGEYVNPKFSHDGDGQDAELFAFHYIVGDSLQQVWRVYDFVKDCPVDIICYFTRNSLKVTDLDNDGIAEIWMVYKIACRGDVSPNEMKLIMYEGKQKYAMRGRDMAQVSDSAYEGGDYKFDPAFTAAPAMFKDYAVKLWKLYTKQNAE